MISLMPSLFFFKCNSYNVNNVLDYLYSDATRLAKKPGFDIVVLYLQKFVGSLTKKSFAV